MWDPTFFQYSESIRDRYFLFSIGSTQGSNLNVMIMIVYAPQDRNLKAELWDKNEHPKNSFPGVRVVLGD